MKVDRLFVCWGLLFVCLFVCLVGWLVGWLVDCLFGWLVGWLSARAYDSRSSYCEMEALQYSFRMRLNSSFPTVSTSFNDIRKL
jgi:hypothetical protein